MWKSKIKKAKLAEPDGSSPELGEDGNGAEYEKKGDDEIDLLESEPRSKRSNSDIHWTENSEGESVDDEERPLKRHHTDSEDQRVLEQMISDSASHDRLELIDITRSDTHHPAPLPPASRYDDRRSRASKRDQNWDAQYEALVAYANKHGHCNIRTGYTVDFEDKQNVNLYAWLALQRRHKKSGKLRPDRMQRLQLLVNQGQLSWSGTEPSHREESSMPVVMTPPLSWNDYFDALLIFAEEHGHANVSLNTPVTIDKRADIDLGSWLESQRQAKEEKNIPDSHFRQLNTLANEGRFSWRTPEYAQPDLPREILDQQWEVRYQAMSSYAREHPEICNADDITATIRTSDGDFFDLNLWIQTQRRKYHLNLLSPYRLEKLTGLVNEGLLAWVSKAEIEKQESEKARIAKEEEDLWTAWYNVLVWHGRHKGYCDLEATATVALPDGSEAELGKWLHMQRSALKRAKMPEDRAKKLLDLVEDKKLDAARWKHIFQIRYPQLLASSDSNKTNPETAAV